ncbi:flavin reductase family protein [Pseudooceanicola marinus]|uniref:flavin reductase family protein n=1 Tax=Pseudooceanicola marinus TaxID=396013 RepID=UPI001CD814FA|nr:flavin reductase family protein [Pseudooceanicola marinus]MCA1336552.1 flavin reductase family protein [Pseudooceanicola marinus]
MSEDPLRQNFLEAMSRAATTVNVVTTDGPAGRAGVTVSAMASVSADTERPTLLVCLYHKVSAVDPIRENGTFCVNVLREDQSRISDAFAGRVPDLASRFDAGSWHDTSLGVPRLDGAVCSFVCRIDAAQLVGTHYVVFGAVEEVVLGAPGKPLVHANRGYASPLALDGH